MPKIFIWDRFFSGERKGGLAVRMIYKHNNRSLPLEHALPNLPIESVIDVPPDGYVLAETGFKGGNTTLLELAFLCNIVKVVRPKICLEIGTFDGRTTLHMALNTPEGTKIYTLDLPNEEREDALKTVTLLFDKEKYSYLRNKIVPLYGDSKTFDFGFLKNSADFIFIDGNHDEDYALNNSKVALECLGQGGVIVWHDYTTWDGVTKGLDLFSKMNPSLNIVHLQGTSLAVLKND